MTCTRKIIFMCLIVLQQQAMYHYYPSPYRPTIFGGEPRLVQDWMTSASFNLRGGTTQHGLTANKNHTSALCIYGLENIRVLAQGVPQTILDCNPDCYFNDVWRTCPRLSSFGHVKVDGILSFIEFTPTLIQNLNHGLFLSLTVPVGHLAVKNIRFTDLSTRYNAGTQINFARWQYAINSLANNLAAYGVNANRCIHRGLGDIQLVAGWGTNYENTEVLDYIDFTVVAGANFPTGAYAQPTNIFSLPLGYNGHWGIPVIAYFSLGAFDWLTIGMRGGALWFFDKTYCLPMKTAADQSGWIRLTQGNARVHKGPIWHIEEYFKLDHFVENLSLVFGFGHDHACRTTLCPGDTATFSPTIVNSDERLQSWIMNRFHWVLEFDMATYRHPNFPRIAFTIDKAFSGKRIMTTSVFGAYLGVDFEWCL